MKKIFFILLAMVIFFSCNRKKYLEQDVNGSVLLYDQAMRVTDLSGMKVALSNYDDTAVTDENGLYYFKDVPVGTYKVTFIKEGYPQVSIDNFQIIGNGQEPRHIRHADILQYPTIEIKNFRDTAVNSFYSDIKADIDRKDLKPQDKVAIIGYIAKYQDVSIYKYERRRLYITKDNYIMLKQNFGVNNGEYIVFYACPYYENNIYSTSNDTVIYWKEFLMATDEKGKVFNPYYKKISQVYKMEQK